MNQTVLRQPSTREVVEPLARLSGPHGYRFDGDRVHLHTRFDVLQNAAHQRSWALQLWACSSAPTSTRDLSGQIVAEVALPPMSEVADETEQVDMDALASPPAGDRDHIMALVLASGRPGQFDEVHDVAIYPQPQRFLQPRMQGTVRYCIEGSRVKLLVEHVENTREATNVSGTLALELWALPQPYTGGTFQGVPLAGVVIGALAGQTESNLRSFDLPFAQPADGVWHFVLMLREWTAAGYVTRDYTNFRQPVSYGSVAPARVVSTEPIPAIAPVTIKQTVASKVDASSQPADTIVESGAKTSSKPVKGGKSEGETSQPTKPPVVSRNPRLISINSGTEAELCAIEGLSPKLVQSIIKRRPFASLDDVLRVKGISAKLLATIRSRLTL
jgi:DNA uptake protein ComE-like DNA-binding protein